MSVTIVSVSERHHEVYVERLGLIGHIFEFNARPFKFKWTGDTWTKLTRAENTAVWEAVTPKVTLLNITRRLTK